MIKLNASVLKFLCLIFLINLIYPAPAHAYLDPGTGSMVIQAIIAAFVGIGCSFGILKNKIAAIFGKSKGQDDEQ